MKTLYWIVPVMGLAGMAQAADGSGMPDSGGHAVADASLSGTAAAHYRVKQGRKIGLPGGDLRSCLELKNRVEIIRCSETRRKR